MSFVSYHKMFNVMIIGLYRCLILIDFAYVFTQK